MEKKVKCDPCEKYFYDVSKLNTHNKNVHEEDETECVFCKKVYKNSTYFKKHMKAVHDKHGTFPMQKDFKTFQTIKIDE